MDIDAPNLVAPSSEVEIKSVFHDGWDISVRSAVAEGGLRGSVEVARDGVVRCRLTASEAFDNRQRVFAVLVARADKWIALQASLGASRA